MNKNILIDNQFRWQRLNIGKCLVYYVGRKKTVSKLLEILDFNNRSDLFLSSKKVLMNLKGHFAVIIDHPEFVVAITDKIRSYPIFYSANKKQFVIGNSADKVKDALALNKINALSVQEFKMAGYVTSKETLFENLFQITAGQFLIWNKNTYRLKIENYYTYYSSENSTNSEEDLINELDTITNDIFRRICEEANDNPIWVPLSGGLDSRLVLCKLKQLGYSNLHSFSYGPKGSYDSKAAKYVSDKLGVPWSFFPSTMKKARQYFNSSFRNKHFNFASGFSTLPMTQDIQTYWYNQTQHWIPENAIIINGQSGDFISGGHIRQFGASTLTIETVLDSIVEKHFSLWLDLLTRENVEYVKQKILSIIKRKRTEQIDFEEYAKIYELWEWQERQSKYVVNGQRNYDIFGFAWFLPLWDDEYMHFWTKIPVALKLDQKLFKKYLYSYNFYNLFEDFPIKNLGWPGMMVLAVPVKHMVKFVFGKSAANNTQKILSYWGHYRDRYAYYGFKYYMQNFRNIRNINALNSKLYLSELEIE